MSTRVLLHTKLRNLDGSAFHALGLVSEGCTSQAPARLGQ